jgi:hypothetical protein
MATTNGVELMTRAELDRLEGAQSEQEWNEACVAIREAHGGYPNDWFIRVMHSGLSKRVLARLAAKAQPPTAATPGAVRSPW